MAKIYNISRDESDEEEVSIASNKMLWVIGAVVLVAVGSLLAFSYFYLNRCFDSYKIISSVPRNDSNSVKYYYNDNNIIKCSRSGVSEIDSSGKSLWNGGYDMKQPQLDICENKIMVADVSGKQICIYNGEDEGQSFETSLPVVRAKVSKQGLVAALLEDTDSNILSIYNPYSSADKLVVEIPTNVNGEGYPMDFDIAPDGKSLVASYLIPSGNGFENKVSFYNFTDAGKETNALVGGKSFGKQMVSKIEFLDKNKVIVFFESGFTIFENMTKPAVLAEQKFNGDIRSMAYNDTYIAVVTGSSENKNGQMLHIYDIKGKEKTSMSIPYEYSDVSIYRDQIIFCSNHHCYIMNISGRMKMDCEFDHEIDKVFPQKDGNYVLVNTDSIQQIQLARK